MFERATRIKLRFAAPQGMLSTEDLYDLTVQKLDNLHKKYLKEKQAMAEESLLSTATPKASLVDLRLAIIKHIVEYKLALTEAAKTREAKAAYKQKVLRVLESKEDEVLSSKSIEELQKELEAVK